MAYKCEPNVGDLLQSEFHRVAYDGAVPTKDQSAVDYQYPWTPNEPLQSGMSPMNIETQIERNGKLTSREMQGPNLHSPRSVGQFNSSLGQRRRYSSSRSVTSVNSNSSRRNNIFDDPSFAPPPNLPSILKQNLVISKNTKLPSFDKVTHSGYMLARTSLKSLVMKKWKQIFWITYSDNEVLIFRSKIDFEEWATNPYLTSIQREAIVKLHIDFKIGDDRNGVRCYRAFGLQSKTYKSQVLSTFKLEQWMHYGPVIIGAFASKSPPEIRKFHVLCKEMMKRHKCGLRSYLAKETKDDIDVQSHSSLYSAKSTPNTTATGFY